MDTTPLEWVNLILRWTHVIAAIFWIGHAFLFNEIDDGLTPPEHDDPDGPEGELWMVHGGGFYRVEKTWVYPKRLRGHLKWFKWEAAFTWISGFLLLVVVFYLGGGVYLIDPSKADLSPLAAVGVGVGSLVVGWLVYDALCRTPLVNNGLLFGIVGVIGVTASAWALTNLLSGRAAFLHVGAMLATIMTANVWMIIIPTMTRMVAALRPGDRIDLALGKRAKQRSRHNNYIVFPVLFLMISNHYPTLYGGEHAWAVLGGIVVMGGAIKHVMNQRGEIHGVYWAAVVATVGALGLWAWSRLPEPASEAPPAQVGGARPIDPARTGRVEGTVAFEGVVPAPREVTLINCPQQGSPALLQPVRVDEGRLADVFVWIEGGAEAWVAPPAPTEAVVVDQRGCLYHPEVVGVRTGQPVAFLNSDPVPHNVRAVASDNPAFNEMMVAQDSRIEKRFLKPEVMVEARCDIHPWMVTHLGVVAHPWFSVTGADGGFALEGVPEGTYTLAAWHSVYGVQRREIVVTTGGIARAAFTFGPG